MSILSDLRSKAKTWLDAHPAIEGWGEKIKAAVSPVFHATVDAEVSLAKQMASNAIDAADRAEGPVLNGATEVLGTAFAGAASEYLGPAMGGVATKVAMDGLDRLRDGMIAELHIICLQTKAMLAANQPAPAPAPALNQG